MKQSIVIAGLFLSLLLSQSASALAQMSHSHDQQDHEEQLAASTGYFNVISPTLGGKQVWADELLFHDWRIQRNSITGHYRLLDGHNLRHAWGTFQQCSAKLEIIKRDRRLPAMSGKAVIVLHGLFRNRNSISKLGKHIADSGEYTVFTFGYASTRADVEMHAKGLARVLENLDGITEINFVAHSLGNLVLRRYLAEAKDNGRREPDPRIHRIVMIGAPNNGAQLARTLSGIPMFSAVTGAVGNELGHGWEELSQCLCVPSCEFGIIAGGRGDGKGFNPVIPGDDDMVVTVEETRLPGARDFIVLPVLHSFMMSDRAVMEHALRFLKHGHFVSEDRRQPIAADEAVNAESSTAKAPLDP